MSEMYNTAAEMVLQYMTGHKDDFEGRKPDFSECFPSDQVSTSQPFFDKITDHVQDELNYQLSEFQVSWAVWVFYNCGLESYNKKNNLELSPLSLGEQ